MSSHLLKRRFMKRRQIDLTEGVVCLVALRLLMESDLLDSQWFWDFWMPFGEKCLNLFVCKYIGLRVWRYMLATSVTTDSHSIFPAGKNHCPHKESHKPPVHPLSLFS